MGRPCSYTRLALFFRTEVGYNLPVMKLTSILTDAGTRRVQIHEKAVAGVQSVFPLQTRNHTIEVENLAVTPKEFSSREQKEALLHGHTLQEPLKGDVLLKDKDGKLIQKRENITLAQIPFFTPRHTFIVDGNEYSVAHQRRVRPGIYTRVRGNEELEAAFNLGRGENFRISMDPAKGHMYLQYGTTNIPLYPILKHLGVPDADLNKAWGSGVVAQNKAIFNTRKDTSLQKLYERLIPEYRREHETSEAKAQAVTSAYRDTLLDPIVTIQTLGEGFTHVTPTALVRASQKLLDVHRQGVETDDRDSLAYQSLHSVEDFIKERITLEGRNLAKKVKIKASMTAQPDLARIIPPSPFTKTLRSFMTQSSLSGIPTQINPVEIMDSAVKVTSLGEGGIGNERAVPDEARQVHPTHLNFLDPARTPESYHAGVDLRAALFLKHDDHGHMYTTLYNPKTKKNEDVPIHVVEKSTVAFPGELLKTKSISAMRDGKVSSVAANEVDYNVIHPSHMFTISTNMVPMVESIEGVRLLMGAKHVGQALPLLHREAPLVQVASYMPGRSMEQEVARLTIPIAPVAGTIKKIDEDYIYLQPSGKKNAEVTEPQLKIAEIEHVALAEEPTPQYLYHYGPEGVDLSAEGLKSPWALRGTPHEAEFMRKYGPRAAEFTGKPLEAITPADIFAWLESNRGPGGSRMVSLLAEPIPEAATERLRNFATKPLYQVDIDKAIRNGYVDSAHIVEETPRSQRLVAPEDLYSELQRIKPSNWMEDTGQLLFAKRPHAFVSLKSGILPKELVQQVSGVLKHAENKTAAAPLIKIPYDTNFPLSSKTYLHNNPIVKAGDEVDEDQLLTDSNFTRDGRMALGVNLNVAYLPHYGANTNDAVVISESASKKLTSEHMYKEAISVDDDVTLSKNKHRAAFGSKWTAEQYGKLDEDGVAKPGTEMQPGDPLFLSLRKSTPTVEQQMLGKLHRGLALPFREISHTWEHRCPGTVMDVVKTPRQVMITLKTTETAGVGDKITNRYGGKGVISQILPDAHMPQSPSAGAVDVLMAPTGVHGRINPAQVLEAALAKVAKKKGEPIIVPSLSGRNNIKWIKGLLKENDLTDKEVLDNPLTGQKIKGIDGKGIMTGPQYIYKLFKSTETNYSARGVEDYDVNLQPAKGGATGAKAMGRMEINALLAHNARNVLKEVSTLKSNKNDEFWRAYQLGLPPPPTRTSFASEKFMNMLRGAGIKVDKSREHVTLGPMTDADIKQLSAGAISKPLMVREKDLSPEPGGLFDPVVTGGASGDRWAHVDLHEPIVNPTFEDPVRRLLGMTEQEFRNAVNKEGGKSIQRRLAGIDLDEHEKKLRAEIKEATGTALDNAVKQLKTVQALQREKLTPDKAFVLSRLPVVPPVVRPILPAKGQRDLLVADANFLYRDAMLANDMLSAAKKSLPDEEIGKARLQLYDATKAVFGLAEPTSPQLAGRGAKGFITTISGQGSPKQGYFHGKVLYRPQDTSGRATVVPDLTLNMDEIGIPEPMLWSSYAPHIIRRLVQNGYKAVTAKQMVEDQHPAARDVLLKEIKERPVYVNRAPTLHRYNVVGAYPIPVPGKSIRVNPFMEKGQGMDYDGDTLQLHVPAMPGAVNDVKQMTLSNLLFGDKSRNDLLVFPQHEAITGIYMATTAKGGKKRKFKTKAEALAAYKRGEVQLNDEVELG